MVIRIHAKNSPMKTALLPELFRLRCFILQYFRKDSAQMSEIAKWIFRKILDKRIQLTCDSCPDSFVRPSGPHSLWRKETIERLKHPAAQRYNVRCFLHIWSPDAYFCNLLAASGLHIRLQTTNILEHKNSIKRIAKRLFSAQTTG